MRSLWLVPSQGEPIRIDDSPVTVGRDASANVVLRDPSVSRRHAVLERGSQSWMVADQASGNGTWIDGQRVIKALLREGQSLRFGAVDFKVTLHEPARDRRPSPPPIPARKAVAAHTPIPPAPANPTPVPAATPAGSLSLDAAAEILGVAPGAGHEEVRGRYQRIYNDLQIRLTNAPTASLKRMYQKNLQNLKLAAETLAPGVLGERP
jgi:predicted component of type VI protein secretion system